MREQILGGLIGILISQGIIVVYYRLRYGRWF